MTTMTVYELRKNFIKHLILNDTPKHARLTLADDVNMLMYIQYLMIHEQITIAEMFENDEFHEILHEQIIQPKTFEQLVNQ